MKQTVAPLWRLLNYPAILAAFFAVGLAGHLVPATRPLMIALTPWFLPLAGLSALWQAWPDQHRLRLLVWVLLASLVTFALEVAGVATGLIFGQYAYGNTLGLQLSRVPLVIGLNWVLVILGFAGLLAGRPGARWWGGPAAAALATGFDWVMEPVAMKLDYWQWAGGEIPLQNYLAWFLIALVFATSFLQTGVRLKRQSLLVLALIELVFFAVLRVCLVHLAW